MSGRRLQRKQDEELDASPVEIEDAVAMEEDDLSVEEDDEDDDDHEEVISMS